MEKTRSFPPAVLGLYAADQSEPHWQLQPWVLTTPGPLPVNASCCTPFPASCKLYRPTNYPPLSRPWHFHPLDPAQPLPLPTFSVSLLGYSGPHASIISPVIPFLITPPPHPLRFSLCSSFVLAFLLSTVSFYPWASLHVVHYNYVGPYVLPLTTWGLASLPGL